MYILSCDLWWLGSVFHENALIYQKLYFKKYIFGLCTIEKISSVHLNKVHN